MTDASGSKGAAPAIMIGDSLAGRALTRLLIPTPAQPPRRPPSDRVWTLEGPIMGARWSVRAVPPPEADQAALTRAVQEELDAVAAVFDHRAPAAEVARFNAVEAGTWSVSEAFWSLLNAALDIGDDTNGAFDPTLGALADLWGFGTAGPRVDVPDEAAIEAAMAVSGWQGLRLDRQHHAVMQPGGTRLDFSALICGHAADRVSERLIREGATAHLIEIDGAMKGVGVKPDGQPWWVEIRLPDGLKAPRTVAALMDLAMATSEDDGDFGIAGVRYPHILDGAAGRPAGTALASVTVLHASAMQADALATAMLVMGPVEGPNFAATLGLAAHFVERGPRGLIEGVSPAFAAMLDEGEDD